MTIHPVSSTMLPVSHSFPASLTTSDYTRSIHTHHNYALKTSQTAVFQTTSMEALNSPSSSPSHYSPKAIGFLVGAGAVALILIIGWIYIAQHGGPSKMLHTFRERREAECKARDIEMAETAANADRVLAQARIDKKWDAEQAAARQEALDQLNGLHHANVLVGSTLPARSQQFDFERERREQDRLRRVRKGEQLRETALMQEKERQE